MARVDLPIRHLLISSLAVPLIACAVSAEPAKPVPGLEKVNHIIVIYLENRIFDNLYGLFPGADGIAQAASAPPQVDKSGKPYETLPPVLNTNFKPPVIDSRFPTN